MVRNPQARQASALFEEALREIAPDLDCLFDAIRAAEVILKDPRDERERLSFQEKRQKHIRDIWDILSAAHRKSRSTPSAASKNVTKAAAAPVRTDMAPAPLQEVPSPEPLPKDVPATPPPEAIVSRRTPLVGVRVMIDAALAHAQTDTAPAPPQKALLEPLSEDTPVAPTREVMLREIEVLTLKLERGEKEREKARARIRVIVTTWFDAHYGAEDRRLVKACVPFVEHLPTEKRFSALRKRVREAIGSDPTGKEQQTEEPIVIPANWPWQPYFTGKRIAIVGGLETDLRRVLERNLAPATITWFQTEGSEDTRVRASLFRQIRGAFDLIIVTRFAPRLFGLEVLTTARQLQVPAFRVKSGSNLAQIQRAAEGDLPVPKPN